MKKFNKKRFTMVEMMMIVGILCILISISWVAGTTIIRKSALAQTKAELKMLHNACEMYKARYGLYPVLEDSEVNFAQHLSKVPSGSTGYSADRRPMFIDFRAARINISNNEYDAITASETIVSDPYDQAYEYIYNSTDNTFFIYSEGLTSTGGFTDDDDVRSDKLNE